MNKYSKVLVLLIILMNISFTVAVLYVFSKTSSEPAVLIGSWFGFTTGELWMMASIKKAKVKGVKIDGNRLEKETDK